MNFSLNITWFFYKRSKQALQGINVFLIRLGRWEDQMSEEQTTFSGGTYEDEPRRISKCLQEL